MEIDGEKGPVMDRDVQRQIDQEDKQIIEQEMAGGFFPDEADFAQPARRDKEPVTQEDFGGGDGGSGGFLPDDEGADDEGGGFVPDDDDDDAVKAPISMTREHSFESSILDSQQFRPRRRSSFADDFILEEDDYEDEGECGGFVRNDKDEMSDAVGEKAEMEMDVDGADEGEGEKGVEEAEEQGGGFIPEDATEQPEIAEPQGAKQDVAMTSDHEHSSQQSEPSDTGSLPLEDPEDEDADPDWLVDVT
jgi:xeroderma pigmentosum group C-complementing protein